MAIEAREIVRRAVGDAVGLTIKAQVRQAARNLGFPAESWRPREAFYGRAGGWSAAALDDLRARYTAWCAREKASRGDVAELVRHIREVRAALAHIEKRLLETEAAADRLFAREHPPP